MHRHHLALGVVAGVAVFALPVAAEAATGTVDRPCYTHVPTGGTQPIVVTLTGGTPGADFQVVATVPGKGDGSAGSTTGTFDAAGNATAQIENVYPPSGSIDPIKGQTVQLAVRDWGGGPDPVEQPLPSVLITNLAVDVSSTPRNPRAKRAVKISGDPFAGKTVYGFITSSNGKKILRRIKIGKGDVCGFVKTKAVVAPSGAPRGSYRFYLFGGKTLNRKLAVGQKFSIS